MINKHIFGSPGVIFKNLPGVPKQTNTYDCGVYCLEFMVRLST